MGTNNTREMENISRDPTYGDFVTILTVGSMQDNTDARLLSTRVQTPLSHPLLNVMLRERLSEDSQILLAQYSREGGRG